MQMDPLNGKRLVILGMARQGTALARFAVGVGAFVTLSDMRPADQLSAGLESLADLPAERLHFVLGHHPFELLDACDVLSISGGVPVDAPIVVEARKRGIPLTNDSLEFMRRTPALVVGITGSAGKTTTTALVGQMGQKSNRRTWIGGNIGRPLITDLEHISAGDLVVKELSSFQLEIWAQCSPPVAAILNITPNHLDRHKTMADYAAAKGNILRFQKPDDIAILSADDPGSMAMHQLVRGRLRLFSAHHPVDDGAFVRDNQIWLKDSHGEKALCPVSTGRLLGAHNVLNTLAAVTAADSAGLPRRTPEAIARQYFPGSLTPIGRRLRPSWVYMRRTMPINSSSAGPTRSANRPPGPASAISTKRAATSRAATGRVGILGIRAMGPIVIRCDICAANSWNWVARRIDQGADPAETSRSCASLPA